MTAGSGLASPPVRLPKLVTKEKSPSKPTKRASTPPAPRKSSFVVVDGVQAVRTAPVKTTRRSSRPLPLPRTAGVLSASRPLLRRRRGDFSLPVKYKYVVIPGNNSRAVLAAFRRRPWWGPARKEQDLSAAAVVRSSFVSRRKKGGGEKKNDRDGDGAGKKVGYSNKTFNLWWEMYASKPVIESTNLDPNVRQAVNHFEFNDALVSKKGLWQSLRAYCASSGFPVTSVVPRTFYLSGGSLRSATSPTTGKTPSGSRAEGELSGGGGAGGGGGGVGGGNDDDRTEFLAFCAAMDALSGASSARRPRSPGATATVEETSAAGAGPPQAERVVPGRDRDPMSRTSPNVTPAAALAGDVEEGTGGGAAAAAKPCHLETAARSEFDSNPPAAAAVKAAPAIGELVEKDGCLLQVSGANSCPPDTVVRSASPPPPPLSPSRLQIRNPARARSPEATPSSRDGGAGRGVAMVSLQSGGAVSFCAAGSNPGVASGPALGVSATGAAGGCPESEIAGGAQEGEAAGLGPVLRGGGGGRGGEGEWSENNSTECGENEPDKEGARSRAVPTTESCRSIRVGARPKEVARSRSASVSVEMGGTAGGRPTWVVKPAANSNCGFGIQVCSSLKEVLGVVDDTENRAGRSGWVVQRYIERPLLVRGRKFDIRLFVLLVADPSTRSWRRRSKSFPKPCRSSSSRNNCTSLSSSFGPSDSHGNSKNNSDSSSKTDGNRENGVPCSTQPAKGGSDESKGPGLFPVVLDGRAGAGTGGKLAPASGGGGGEMSPPPCPLRAWCHQNAYVRMSSVRYSNDPSKVKDRFVHLTNNAVQRRSPSYGQDEPGNKLTLADLQDWLDGDGSSHKGKANGWVEQTLRPRMHSMVATSVAAAASAGINKRGRPYAFELLGYDFMVDDDLRVWLIEVNSNPCLEFVCPLLQGMIVRVIDDTLAIALDPVFRPPEKYRTASVAALGGADSEIPGSGFSTVYPGAVSRD